jgi:hypothetical protein
MKGLIPLGWRICGENLYARHSISYDDLRAFFLVFAVFDDNNVCLSVSDTMQWCSENHLNMVPHIYWGVFDLQMIMSIFKEHQDKHEGLVVRLENSFSYDSLPVSMAKWVRAGHVQTDEHWMFQKIVANKVRA